MWLRNRAAVEIEFIGRLLPRCDVRFSCIAAAREGIEVPKGKIEKFELSKSSVTNVSVITPWFRTYKKNKKLRTFDRYLFEYGE